MKNVRVNGVQLTALEWMLIEFNDVRDTNELRDIAVLRTRQEQAGFASRSRLQRQIDALQAQAEQSTESQAET